MIIMKLYNIRILLKASKQQSKCSCNIQSTIVKNDFYLARKEQETISFIYGVYTFMSVYSLYCIPPSPTSKYLSEFFLQAI